jgi:hypothetical protein
MSALSQKNIRAMSALPPIAYGAGVIAYGVRVSAYGISHQWLHRPRKRLRSGLGHTVRSARSAGPLVGPARDVQPARRHCGLKHLIAQNNLLPIPRPGRHSHFFVRLALDNDRSPIAGSEFSENFCELLCPAGGPLRFQIGKRRSVTGSVTFNVPITR